MLPRLQRNLLLPSFFLPLSRPFRVTIGSNLLLPANSSRLGVCHMTRRYFSLMLAVPFLLSTFSLAQEGSRRDLREDEEQLHREQVQLDRDRDRLAADRRHRAPRYVIRADEEQIRRDHAAIKRIR